VAVVRGDNLIRYGGAAQWPPLALFAGIGYGPENPFTHRSLCPVTLDLCNRRERVQNQRATDSTASPIARVSRRPRTKPAVPWTVRAPCTSETPQRNFMNRRKWIKGDAAKRHGPAGQHGGVITRAESEKFKPVAKVDPGTIGEVGPTDQHGRCPAPPPTKPTSPVMLAPWAAPAIENRTAHTKIFSS
jgi:hypothetical protein